MSKDYHRVSFQLPKDVYLVLKELSLKENLPMASFLRKMLLDHIEEYYSIDLRERIHNKNG